jgi:hypothetical protein
VFMVSVPLMEWLNQNAKSWRNKAFEDAYGKKVSCVLQGRRTLTSARDVGSTSISTRR